MQDNRSIKEARAKMLSRIWICAQCGAKVYCGKQKTRPNVICLCGNGTWRPMKIQGSKRV